MKAIIARKYGPPEVLTIEEIEKPAPKDKQVLVKVLAASINAADYHLMRADIPLVRLMGEGLLKPKNPRTGMDVAGRVEAVGENVTQFQPGDEVFGDARGAFAEYVLAREMYLATKPAGVSFEQAAAVPTAGLTALQAIRWAGGIRSGQKVLVQGASGGVGTFAMQLAKVFGAEVTAVCSPRNLELARSLGAEHVIDYTREDFTRGRQRYDLIIAVNGFHSIFAYRQTLCPGGVYVCVGGAMTQMFQAMLLGPWLSRKGDKKLGNMGIAKVLQEDLVYLGELLDAGQITSVIDRNYRLEEIREAFRYFEEEHAQGKVVIKV
jgi:NADPH:quinone reductase-like Zn-dependent oxidoreductase